MMIRSSYTRSNDFNRLYSLVSLALTIVIHHSLVFGIVWFGMQHVALPPYVPSIDY